MDTAIARRILGAEAEVWKRRPYAELAGMVGQSRRSEHDGPSGTCFQVEVQFLWDHRPNGPVRVMASIDDGGWRAWKPIIDDFIMLPDGRLAGET